LLACLMCGWEDWGFEAMNHHSLQSTTHIHDLLLQVWGVWLWWGQSPEAKRRTTCLHQCSFLLLQPKTKHGIIPTTLTAIMPSAGPLVLLWQPTRRSHLSSLPPSLPPSPLLPSSLPQRTIIISTYIERREQQHGAQEAYGRHRSGTYCSFPVLSSAFSSPPLIGQSTHLPLPFQPSPPRFHRAAMTTWMPS